MEVTYENNREDIQALAAIAQPGMKQGMFRLLGGSALAFAPTLLFLLVLGHWLLWIVVVGLMAALGLLMLITFWKQLRVQFDQIPIPEGSLTLRLEEEFLEIRGDRGRSRRRWRAFSKLEEVDRHWVLSLANRTVYVIPKRAFFSVEREQEFIARLRHCLATAASGPQTDLLARCHQDQFFPEPEQPAWRLQFPGPVHLWQRVALMGDQFNTKVNLTTVNSLIAEGLMPMVMGIGVIALRMSAEHYERSLSPLYFAILLITCLVLTVFAARVIQWYQQRVARPDFEREFGGETRVELSPVGVSVGTSQMAGFHEWPRLLPPVILEESVVLRILEGQSLTILPMSIFSSPEDYQQCLLDILRWQSTDETDFRDEAAKDLPEVRETGNPFQSPSTE
ncbi:MAG: YcxB family protein [Pirellulaceae bacterium]